MSRKNIGSAIFLLLLFAVTVVTVVQNNDMSAVVSAIKTIKSGYLFLGILMGIFFVSAEGFLIWYLLKAMGVTAKIYNCLKYSFIGYFFSGITPSSTGGQPAQVYYMKKDNIRFSDSSVVLMIVAVIFKFVIVVIGMGLLIFNGNQIKIYLGTYSMLYYLGLVLNIVVIIALIAFMGYPSYSKKIIFFIEKILIKLHVLKKSNQRKEKIVNVVTEYQQALQYLKKHKFKICIAIFITFLQRVSIFLLTYFIYLGFGLKEVDMFTVVALQASIYVAVDMLPLPGAAGITELMFTTVFATVFKGELLTASLLVTRGINFYILMCIGFMVTIWAHLKQYSTGNISSWDQ